MISGEHSSARSNCSRESTSISMVVPGGVDFRAAAIAVANGSGPASAGGFFDPGEVIVLDQNRVVEAESVIAPPPHRTAYFSRKRQPGVVLRVSKIAARVPSTAATYRAVKVAIPLNRCKKVECRPFHGKQRLHRAGQVAD